MEGRHGTHRGRYKWRGGTIRLEGRIHEGDEEAWGYCSEVEAKV